MRTKVARVWPIAACLAGAVLSTRPAAATVGGWGDNFYHQRDVPADLTNAVVTNWAGSATSEAAVLTVYTNGLSVVPCQIVSGESTGRLVRLTIALEAGCNYRIQSSTNLVDWDDVTNFLSSSATADFLGQAGTNSALRFFRVISP